MYRAINFFLFAILATFALAAPMPKKAVEKKSFMVHVKPRSHGTPLEEMARAYRKFGWEIISFPNPWGGIFGSGSESGSGSSAAESSFAVFPSFAASTPGVAAPTGTGVSSFIPAPSSAPTGGSNYSSPLKSHTSTASSAQNTGASSTGSGNTGEVQATPSQGDSEYNSPVSIGGQTLSLDFDTGSSDLWVYSAGLPSDETSGHTVFNPSKSNTFSTYQGGSFQLSYGDGSTASGTVGFDTVNIGGATATKQAVELATSLSGNFLNGDASDGLVGLGFSNINQVQPQPQKTFFENVIQDLDQPVLTADLGQNSGTYEFGTIDSSKYSGQIHYAAVDSSSGYWQFDSPSYSVGGKQSACSTCSPAIADTGTSLLLVDNDVAEAYYAQVNGAQLNNQQGGYVYDCSASTPDFGVAIGSGYTATIPGSKITYQEIGGGQCFGGVQPVGASAGESSLQIYGDFFLKNVFAVFDGTSGNTRFGVAEKN